MTQNESAIEQINLGFNEQEDRLLLKVGLADKTEITLWITRRVCKSMWSSLQNTGNELLPTAHQFLAPTIATADAKDQALESFMRESDDQKKIENLDFKSEYVAGRQARSDEPMLAVQSMIVSIANLPPHLELQCTNGQSVKMALTNELVHALTSMMQLATREAGWDLLMPADNAPVNISTSTQTLH
ncbi:MAG: hypothetical protein EXR38_05325 [Methylotenera sp.]|nr:hypothetical protein [Methylotenera sp.]MSP99900.1 hypothetical protein [Methylotenera sp.]